MLASVSRPRWALATRVNQSVAKLGADRTMVLFLGDNIYPKGMPPEGDRERRKAERILDAQVAAVGAARGVFILGNHDWNQGDEDGYERAMAQIRYLQARPENISVEPHNACPGPSVNDFGENLRFVFGDLWSAIYGIENPDSPPAMCVPPPGEGRVLRAFREVFEQSRKRRVVLVFHPPVMTSGPHGGYFPWREHLFPLRVFHRDLWIPIPILGSLFPISRILGVTDTDLMGASYRIYVEGMKALLAPGSPALVASGHEHSLQIHVGPLGVFHAVSGAGSTGKVDYVRDMSSDLMSLAAPGFMRLDEYAGGTLTLTVIALGDDRRARRVFYTCIP